MGHQVEELKEHKEPDDSIHEFLAAGPCWWAVLWVQEEVHVDESKDEPVVERILEEVEHWHAIVRETMDIQRFKLALEIVSEHQRKADLLVHGKGLICLVDLFAEAEQQGAHHDRACILKQEDCLPGDLRTQIFEDEGDGIICT